MTKTSTPSALRASSPVNRAAVVDGQWTSALTHLRDDASKPAVRRLGPGEPLRPGLGLTACEALRIFEAQVLARHLDFEARALKARGEGFYTISGAGHEANACVAAALAPTDPALLHYRSGAFVCARAQQVPGETPGYDILLSMCASTDDPIAGGRHKVFGSKRLAIPPQTSTIASHLPKALGLAIGIERARHLKLRGNYPDSAIVVCSFGDASFNHATAQSALHATGWLAHQGLPAPVLYVCEDNGTGISVPTPKGWVEAAMRGRPGIHYRQADGRNLGESFATATEVVEYVRRTRRPAFLHLMTKRLMGHAGSDVETTYRSLAQIRATEALDPLLAMARELVAAGAAAPVELLALYERTRDRVRALAKEAARRPKQTSLAEVMAPLAPRDPGAVRAEAGAAPDPERRASMWKGEQLPEASRPRHMAKLLSWALRDLLARYPEMLVFGEDVGKKGGVYHVTDGLQRAAGRARVFDTLLDETTILGLAMGAGMAGLLPAPEIQYLAYLHNALDQIRGEACSLQFFSNDQFRNPMVCRVASLGYQKGFGGHFHNDPSTTALRDIPGLVIACPSRGDDAVAMLRTLFAAAKRCGTVSAFLEPIALYMAKDLFEPGDARWSFAYPLPGSAHVAIGEARLYGEGADLAIVTYGNGVPMSLRAQRTLLRDDGIAARVLDLRWLAPLDEEAIVQAARACGGRVLVVCEGRRAGGAAEPIMALLAERLAGGGGDQAAPLRIARVTGADTFIPLGAAANLCLPQESDIVRGARALLGLARPVEAAKAGGAPKAGGPRP